MQICYYFTLTEHLKKRLWNLEKLSVNFPLNLAFFQKAPVKFRIFLHELAWSLSNHRQLHVLPI